MEGVDKPLSSLFAPLAKRLHALAANDLHVLLVRFLDARLLGKLVVGQFGLAFANAFEGIDHGTLSRPGYQVCCRPSARRR